MTTAIEAPALSLRERALAAVQAAREAEAARVAEAARREAEQADARWQGVRTWIQERFGIDADWRNGRVVVDGLTLAYRARVYEYEPPAGLCVVAQCRVCGFVGRSEGVASVYSLGVLLERFQCYDEVHYHGDQTDIWSFDVGGGAE